MKRKASDILFAAGALIALVFCACHTPVNGYKKGQRQGMWIVYTDSSHTRISEKGRYRNGEQTGKWIYNTDRGEPYRVVKYRGSNIKIKGYYPDGTRAERGQAKFVSENGKLHFYYYGKWKYYKADGSFEKTTVFEKGHAVKDIYASGEGESDKIRLRLVLKKLERDFDNYTHILNEAQQTYGVQSAEYKAKLNEKLKNDSSLYARIDSVLATNGYPRKEQVGDDNGIIFYIVSFGNWKTKEKYLDAFRKAAEKNDLRPKDLAFFEDKLYVAKGGYQLYGTQGLYDKNYHLDYYPVKDLQNLNARRKEKGLEEADISLYQEKKN